MIKANFIQVSVTTNYMVQLLPSDLAPPSLVLPAPHDRSLSETLSQAGLHQTDTLVLIFIQKFAEITSRSVSSITFEKTEQTYSWQIQEVLSKPVLRILPKLWPFPL